LTQKGDIPTLNRAASTTYRDWWRCCWAGRGDWGENLGKTLWLGSNTGGGKKEPQDNHPARGRAGTRSSIWSSPNSTSAGNPTPSLCGMGADQVYNDGEHGGLKAGKRGVIRPTTPREDRREGDIQARGNEDCY